ncbi:hypothetical protein C8J57DRAFT_1219769 [Mycena rebaudengoi]|nr:hypothetical protein C8J57DRAFT_1219769 [Mycena rebaudengoi]
MAQSEKGEGYSGQNGEQPDKTCDCCGKPETAPLAFGGKACQKNAWPVHKLTCKLLGEIKRLVPTTGNLEYPDDSMALGDICQKQHWPRHKATCVIDRNIKIKCEQINHPKFLPDITKFYKIFKAEITDATCYALRLQFDRFAGYSSVFEIQLLYIPDSQKAHSRFKLIKWGCVPFSKLEHQILNPIKETLQIVTTDLPDCVHCFVLFRAIARGDKKWMMSTHPLHADPDLGPWNANWEEDFVGGITIVQNHGVPRLR